MSNEIEITKRMTLFEAETLPHRVALYQSARSLLRAASEAEDMVQETYLLAWKSFDNFQPGTNCRAWLFSILFNVVRHHRRKWLSRFQTTEDSQILERSVAVRPEADQNMADRDILAAIRALPQRYAEVILLSDVQEFTYKEIAETLKLPLGTVMSRLSRGRDALRRSLFKPATDDDVPKPAPARKQARHAISVRGSILERQFGAAGRILAPVPH